MNGGPILLTGAGGQLGRELRVQLAGEDVVALARTDLDIAALDQVRAALQRLRPRLVINAAAYNAVDAAQEDVEGAFRGNAVGPRNLAVATAAAGIALLHVSTDYVFSGTASRPYHEYDRTDPRSVYGASKLAGEEAVRALNPRHYIVRTAWLYHADGKNFAKTISALGRNGEVRVVSDQFGSPTYVPHLARGLRDLMDTGAFGTFHVVNSGEASWYELTRALFAAQRIESPVRAVSTSQFPRPASRPRYSVLATIQEPRIVLPPWQQGVEEFAAAVRASSV
jgi:dTDP-4-dehydrorhamnose reductase